MKAIGLRISAVKWLSLPKIIYVLPKPQIIVKYVYIFYVYYKSNYLCVPRTYVD
jgi:hypothetical protein